MPEHGWAKQFFWFLFNFWLGRTATQVDSMCKFSCTFHKGYVSTVYDHKRNAVKVGVLPLAMLIDISL